ncbi:MAG: hypothetical protein KDA27_09595 [Candidatus Eisenbacteria bacterium]|uniref:Uncharacterized protein n=1 Tax=Eiseniibacteriota bacterium TaxID=2212470 RepID=A0A956NBR6_UNCEI|nr:hypothetical protein [Candidatus Eisenbacteria bacterium]MCB9463931.1 hypothetical protein [Candidatus Eisenbacteria bacterium]
MKIDPPSGPGSKIPELPDDKGTGKVDGPGAARFQGKMDDAAGAAKAEGIDKIEHAQTSELRQILGDIDAGDPNRLEIATDRMVDWVLKDAFGEDALQGDKGSELKAAIRSQLLDDPSQSSRIQRILDRL